MENIRDGYVRVSEILSQLRDRADININVLNAKAAVGTEVHNNIAEYKGDGIPFFDEHPVYHAMTGELLRWEKRGVGYFKSFAEWDKTFKPEYKMMESRFYDDEFMITGQIDALVTLPEKKDLYLIDFKCSYKPDLEIWNMQAHFYMYLLKQNGIEVGDNFIWIQLKKDGKIPSTFSFVYDENMLQRCLDEASKYHERKQEALMLD